MLHNEVPKAASNRQRAGQRGSQMDNMQEMNVLSHKLGGRGDLCKQCSMQVMQDGMEAVDQHSRNLVQDCANMHRRLG